MPSKDREARLRTQRECYYRTKANDPDKIKRWAAAHRAKHTERLVCSCSNSSISVHSKCAHLKTKRHRAYVEAHGPVELKKVANVNDAVQSVEPYVPSEVMANPEQPRDARGDPSGPQSPIPRVDEPRSPPEAQGL